MARFLLMWLVFLSLHVACLGQQLEARHSEHHFGVIREGEQVEHTFLYKNIGQKPLIVNDVRLTCGCTAVEWDKEPLPAGDSTRLTIRFDSRNKLGRQRKVITLISNATNAPTRLQLIGTVLPGKAQK